MQDSKFEARVAALLADRGQYFDTPEFELEGGPRRVPLPITYLDAVHPLAVRFSHLCGYRVGAIAGEAINARAQEKICPDVFGRAEKLVDITLSIANVDAAGRTF